MKTLKFFTCYKFHTIFFWILTSEIGSLKKQVLLRVRKLYSSDECNIFQRHSMLLFRLSVVTYLKQRFLLHDRHLVSLVRFLQQSNGLLIRGVQKPIKENINRSVKIKHFEVKQIYHFQVTFYSILAAEIQIHRTSYILYGV